MMDTGKLLFLGPHDATGSPSDHASATAETPAEACAALVAALRATGYDPATQLMSYLIADDPTYLPEETEARAIARRVGRDKLLAYLLTFYMENQPHEP